MHEVELVLALLVATTVLAPVAKRLNVPYPILLVLGGLVLALAPAVPNVFLAPDLFFLCSCRRWCTSRPLIRRFAR